ncbi:Hypothetical protein CINCED_3A010574 [Cinara cedri]|uniref:Uncharacterized protein n=1 Tax=Cinara cedri TaxID=506608 RepID=A0A5E4NCQ4_9HEMI|nr:Hypothetical protein CINCED_3A010574 [Cinara cedri]
MCTYDQQIVRKMKLNRLLIASVIILMVQLYRVEAQNDEKKLCTSFTEYIIENDFNKNRITHFFNKQQKVTWLQKKTGKKPPKPFLEETLHEQLVKYYKSRKCRQQIKSYSAFNQFYTKVNPYREEIKCDWIRPKLPDTLDYICDRGIGQYLLQHGTLVYHQFLEYLARLPNTKKEKKTPKKEKKYLVKYKKWIEKTSKMRVVGNKLMLLGEQYINAYYYIIHCDRIVHDYNAYYDFYMENYKNIHPRKKNNYYRQSCDLFRRLKKPVSPVTN